ncbi:hypothetical protein [Ructibacterium gallinarum]|uniref:Type II secretion system protein GspF domain-containing protein n=1 Tax=Ructibacterium gallinarum TaxID=2779355 RepID=A0A9D5LX69_9FIRM|nr:hypothetical protein [Ructibacterium gallinarum]MBE5039483.1 hypothetical protein [Ructibacterium gallinarum]
MVYFLIFILLTGGFFAVTSQLLGLPPASTSRGIRIAAHKQFSPMHFVNAYFIAPFVKILAPIVRMTDFKEKRMELQLARAGIPLTPKEYVARSYLMAGSALVLSVFLLSVTMRNMLPLAAVLAAVVYFHFNGEVSDRLKEKDRLIESELPKFVRAIVQGLKTEKDVIKLLETYQTIAGEGLKYDIEVLIMDLKSGNYEAAMLAFDKRVGNAYISRLTKALIAVSRGDNQDSTLNYLISDMGLLAKETMQRELNKRPGRVKMLIIPIVLLAVITLFYVIGMHLFRSLGGIM